MSEQKITHCVTIIHGTFVHGLKTFTKKEFSEFVPISWAKPKSNLHEAINSKFSSQAKIRHFGWSGRNSHSSRESAAKDLRVFLGEGLMEYEHAKHYLVCHSHGGNVAMLALQDQEFREKIAGIACLATPFLIVNNRPLDFSVFKGFFLILLMIACLLGLGAGVLSAAYSLNLVEIDGKRQIFFLLFLVCSLYIVGYSCLRNRIVGYIQSLKAGYEKFILPDLEEKLRVIRSTGDEASGILIVGQFISWVIESLWSGLAIVAKIGSNIWYVLLAFFGGAAALYFMLSSGWSNSFIDTIFEGGNSIYILLPLTTLFGVAAGLQLILFLSMIISSVLRFGFSYPLMGVFMRVTAESTPLGAVESCLIPNCDKGVTKKGGLFRGHTRVYEDPKALEYLIRWMAADKEQA